MPCLVLHRIDDPFCSAELGKQLAAAIPDARLSLVPGKHHSPLDGDVDSLIDEIETFVTGEHTTRVSDRTLTTVLFTDIVGSTELAASLGDAGWRRVLDRHNSIARAHFDRYAGREVKTTGDGFLITFSSPARAIECARALIDTLRGQDVAIRTGIHTGECDVIDGNDVGGMAVHIAARVMEIGSGGEVCVSGTVKDLVVGSDYSFDARGSHELKGVPGRWDVWAIADRRETHGAEEIRDRPLRATDRFALFLARRAPRALRRLAALADREE